jgi:Family of unknown function (DUF6319)
MTDAPAALSEQDLAAARAELAEGRPFPVWFTAAAVGVPVGGSAKIVSVGEPAEGDFVEVRPTGSRDTVFCSPNELTSTRPPRKRARQAAPPSPATPPSPAASVRQPERAPQRPAERNGTAERNGAAERNGRAERNGTAERNGMAERNGTVERAGTEPVTGPERRPSRPRPAARPTEVTVTLSSTAEGEWTVEVVTGRKRTVRPTPVQPAEVAKAARSLPPAVAEAIESSLVAARQRQIERVERLRAELDAAQRALQDLSG